MATTSTLGIVLDHSAGERELEEIVSLANQLHMPAYHATGDGWTAVSVGDGSGGIDRTRFEELEGVERVLDVSKPYRLASRELFDDRPIQLRARDYDEVIEVGGGAPLMAAVAPMAWASGRRSAGSMVDAVLEVGGNILVAGELTSASDDGGSTITRDQLADICDCAHSARLLVSVEVADARDVEAAAHADILQVGHRSMQDFSLLRELGHRARPVIIKRGLGATIEEFLLAAEYVLANGNGRVILCEPGIRAHGSGWKPRFEVNAIPLLKQATHLPVVADPSHSSPYPQLIPAVARAAIAAGADGLILEVETGSDEPEIEGAMDVATCRQALVELKPVAAVMGRSLNMSASIGTVREHSEAAQRPGSVYRARPAEPIDVLHETQGTLAMAIERIIGEAPCLEVMRQIRISPPYPTWLRWLLRPEGDLLVRWTRYVSDSMVLSRNLSYVDFGRVDPTIIARLQAEELNLGQLFGAAEIDKFGFEFGSGVNSGEFDRLLRDGHTDTKSLHPYVWRRYIAATSGRVGFLVFEALPGLEWKSLLHSEEDHTQPTGEG